MRQLNPCCSCNYAQTRIESSRDETTRWVRCVTCGNTSTPVKVSEGSAAIRACWNVENPIGGESTHCAGCGQYEENCECY